MPRQAVVPVWTEVAAAPLAVPTPTMIPGIAPDGSLYPIEKLEAHRRKAFHLATSAFVFSGDELLIQRRALSKYHCGGLWANTCCTHPNWGESVESAAARRLDEELGFTVPLTSLRVVEYAADCGNGLFEHERVTMFRGDVERAALTLRLNPEEVCETRWVSGATLRRELAATPERFTPWLRIYVERFPALDF